MSKPTVEEWVEWARNNNTDLPTIKWVQDNPRVFNEFYQPRSNTMNASNNTIIVPDTIITGASGAQYVPMDTSPQLPPPPAVVEISSTTPLTPQAIVAQISTLLTQLVSVIISQQQAAQPTQAEDFKDTVETILENATWFDKQVEDKVEEHFEGYDISAVVRSELEDNVSDHIERYMNHSFDIEDHVNVEEKVRDELNECLSDEVSEVLDDVLESKVGECLDEMLEDKLVEILSRKTITINM